MQRRKWVRWAIGLTLAYIVVWCGLSVLHSMTSLGIFPPSWSLKTDGTALLAYDMEYELDEDLYTGVHPHIHPPFKFTVKLGVVTVEDKGIPYSKSASIGVWSPKRKKLFLVDNNTTDKVENGWVATYDSEHQFQHFFRADRAILEACLSLDEEYLTLKLSGDSESQRNTFLVLKIDDRSVEKLEFSDEYSTLIRVDSDNFIYTKYNTSVFHSALTNGEGLVYRWSRKTGVSTQITTGGTLVSAMAFDGSIWALRRDLRWRWTPLGAVRERNKKEILRLDSTLGNVVERYEF
jgi:hypothetical protein